MSKKKKKKKIQKANIRKTWIVSANVSKFLKIESWKSEENRKY